MREPEMMQKTEQVAGPDKDLVGPCRHVVIKSRSDINTARLCEAAATLNSLDLNE